PSAVVIDWSFEIDCFGVLFPQPRFDLGQQATTDALALPMRNNIYSDYVAELAWLNATDHETHDLAGVIGHERARPARMHVELQLESRVSDVFVKGGVIYFVESLEIRRCIFSNLHAVICGRGERLAIAVA